MTSWNLFYNRDNSLILINGSDTLIKRHKSITEDTIIDLMSKLEELEFPVQYTHNLNEIHLTYLKGNLEGDYSSDGCIRVACNRKYLPTLHKTFIHEVGHHVDERYDLSSDSLLLEEWEKLSGSFEHVEIHKNPEEYFAIGFEKYYSGDEFSEETHPILWEIINDLHTTIIG